MQGHLNENMLEDEDIVKEDNKGDIFQSEIDFVIDNLKNNKVCGINEIQESQ